MNVYSTVKEFSAPQLGVHLNVLDTVGKISVRTSVLIGGIEYGSDAFYGWVGTTDSLNYLSFVGTVPDPVSPAGALVVGGVFGVTSGSSVVTVTGAAFGFVPTSVVVVVSKPVGGSNLFATVRLATITADGFVADLSAPAPTAGYVLSYAGAQ